MSHNHLTDKHLSVIQGWWNWVWGACAPPICAKNIEKRTDTGIHGQSITSVPFKFFLPSAGPVSYKIKQKSTLVPVYSFYYLFFYVYFYDILFQLIINTT